jgi:hypothetical protein
MTDQPYPLGRIAAPDERDHRFLMAVVLTDEQPALRSVSYRHGPILDQGNTPSCVGHGWRAWLDGEPIQQRRGPSAMLLYHAAQRVDEWPGEEYEGTSVRGGAKALLDLGYIASYIWAFDEPTVKRWMLSKRGGVVIGVNWYTSMFAPDAAGYLSLSGSLAGGHCVWVRGYNRLRDAYRIQNSWGSNWGQNGQAWLRAADLSRLLVEDGECCCGVEAHVRTRE